MHAVPPARRSTVDLREEAVRRAASYDPARELMRWLQRPLGRI